MLNHLSGSRAGIVGVYQRHSWAEEKRAALAAWGERVAAIVEGRETAEMSSSSRAADRNLSTENEALASCGDGARP